MRMRATNISGRESARLSVSSNRQVDEKRPNRTLDAHELFTDTNARLSWRYIANALIKHELVTGSRILVIYALLTARPVFDSVSTGVR